MGEEHVLKLDLILMNIQKMEDNISATKKRLSEVTESIKNDERESTKLLEENKKLEEQIKSTRHAMITSQTKLASNNLFLSNLEEQLAKIEEEKKICLQEMDGQRISEEEAVEKWTRELMKVYNSMRLDNPAIPARRECIGQEMKQLSLEETRLCCEIKVLEDKDKEKEKLENQMKETENKKDELKQRMATLRQKMKEIVEEVELFQKKRDELQHTPSIIVELGCKLNDQQQESDYLQAALEAMKKERNHLINKYGLSESDHSHALSDSQYRAQKRQGGGRKEASKKQRGSQPAGSLHLLHESSSSGNMHNNQHQEPCNSSELDMDTDEFISEMLRDINWGMDGDLSELQETTHCQQQAGKERMNTVLKKKSSTGSSPSTPCTFTRNPAPPTPVSEKENRPLLEHILSKHPAVDQTLQTNVNSRPQTPQTSVNSSFQRHHHHPVTTTIPNLQCPPHSITTTRDIPSRLHLPPPKSSYRGGITTTFSNIGSGVVLAHPGTFSTGSAPCSRPSLPVSAYAHQQPRLSLPVSAPCRPLSTAPQVSASHQHLSRPHKVSAVQHFSRPSHQVSSFFQHHPTASESASVRNPSRQPQVFSSVQHLPRSSLPVSASVKHFPRSVSAPVQCFPKPQAPCSTTQCLRGSSIPLNNTQGNRFSFSGNTISGACSQGSTMRPSNQKILTTTQKGRDVSHPNVPEVMAPRTHLTAPHSHNTTFPSTLQHRVSQGGRQQGPQGKGQTKQGQGQMMEGLRHIQRGQNSPSQRRIRFSELTEVLGTPQSEDGR